MKKPLEEQRTLIDATDDGRSGRRKAKQKQATASDLVNVVVVEYHHHALEHIHASLRKQKLLGKSWRMVHFDAHPDVACPSSGVPAKAAFRPNDPEKSLYERLDDSVSGIAEWILPLVLAADLKRIDWIKPTIEEDDVGVNNNNNNDPAAFPPFDQFPNGLHEFSVGAWMPTSSGEQGGEQEEQGQAKAAVESFLDLPDEALLRVDFETPYYWDDDSVVKTEDLLLAQQVQLNVTTTPKVGEGDSDEAYRQQKQQQHPWHLDICLDYFGTKNPFLEEMTKESTDLWWFPRLVVRTLRSAQQSCLRQHHQRALLQTNITIGDKEHYRHTFMKFLNLFSGAISALASDDDGDDDDIPAITSALRRQQPARNEWERERMDLIQHFVREIATQNRAIFPIDKRRKLCKLATRHGLLVLLLPHEYNVTRSLQQERLKVLQSFFLNERTREEQQTSVVEGPQDNGSSEKQQPFLITLARSSTDGFTPEKEVDGLQGTILHLVHSYVCNCKAKRDLQDWYDPTLFARKGCRMNLIFDYGDWEGTATIE